ncbi:T/G mismatch-specific endonuclease [Granulicella rosea]|uniref:Very short patch repair endonuclease n=1 Tax=Granulicella rosea TaxID=474952 RepID=A0A239DQD7_9BACT|nr:very short patch repair endonuclease [Granulicella rosea]SNS34736.1 T/G mismatch-specific endonuclease [Granulicella rosea]
MTESAEQRSRTMRAVKSSNTAPEMAVRRLLHAMGRYRLHRADLPGKPDIVLPARGKVVFVHGCFWHGHTCARGARKPRTNVEYWERKIGRNRSRDRRVRAELRKLGWGVLSIWECQIKEPTRLAKRLQAFLG